MQKINNFVCEQHLNTCMDDFVNLFETFPILDDISNLENITCSYCNLKAKYSINYPDENKSF